MMFQGSENHDKDYFLQQYVALRFFFFYCLYWFRSYCSEFNSWRALGTRAFPLAHFAGVDVEIKNNSIMLLSLTIPGGLRLHGRGDPAPDPRLALYSSMGVPTFMDFASKAAPDLRRASGSSRSPRGSPTQAVRDPQLALGGLVRHRLRLGIPQRWTQGKLSNTDSARSACSSTWRITPREHDTGISSFDDYPSTVIVFDNEDIEWEDPGPRDRPHLRAHRPGLERGPGQRAPLEVRRGHDPQRPRRLPVQLEARRRPTTRP